MKNPFEKLERKYEKMRRQRDEARAELLELRTIQATIEPSAKYEIKEMHIDCEKKDFEVGKWYKERYTPEDSVLGLFSKKGDLNIGSINSNWCLNVNMADFSLWRLATPEEVKEVLTKRCKELGLFDGELECLSGLIYIYKAGFIDYCEEDDKLWIGNKLAYEKGKFAELVDKKN